MLSSRRVRAQTGHRASGSAQNQLQRRIGRPKETAPGSVLGATETVKQDEPNLERLRCMDGEGAVKEVLRAKREIDEQCQRRVLCAVAVGCGETKKNDNRSSSRICRRTSKPGPTPQPTMRAQLYECHIRSPANREDDPRYQGAALEGTPKIKPLERPNRAQEAQHESHEAPRAPQEIRGGPRRRPGEPQEAKEAPQRTPRRPPETPRRPPGDPQEVPRRPQEPPRGRRS